jgi:hypothetical protein
VDILFEELNILSRDRGFKMNPVIGHFGAASGVLDGGSSPVG